MAFDKKDGFSYLDGLPMKISAKFVPPRPIALPLAFDAELPPDLFAEEYDFSLEKKVLESEQKRQSELEAAKSKSIYQDAPAKFESTSHNSYLSGISQSKTGSDSVLKSNSNTLPWHPNSILQPKPQQIKDVVTNCAVKDASKKINLSDFENDTSSPFDYMELQTLNDFEELSSVFQDLSNKSSEIMPVESLSQLEDSDTNKEIPSSVSKSVSFPLSQNNNGCIEKVSSSSSSNFIPGNTVKSEPQTALTDKQSLSSPSITGACRDINSFDATVNLPHASRFSALSQVPYISSHALRHNSETTDLVSSTRTSLRGCKSYSDIHTLTDPEGAICSEPERSQTPPIHLFTTKVTEPLVEKSGAHPQNLRNNQFSNTIDNGDLNCDNASNSHGLSDPYDELEESAQVIVDSITDMGFSRGQVARAVKHLGFDEKKVVEHLCQIQSFVESGYDSLEAEAALHLHDYNKDEAKTFMDLVNKFQDLGFEKNAIRKALVQNKNDWNKTIDSLLT